MGLYDTVVFRCTCGYKIQAQNKSGPCNLAKYRATSVPLSIAGGLDGAITKCESCGKTYKITPEIRRVRLRLRKLK